MSGSASSPRIQAWSQRSFSPSIARPPANRSLRPASQSPKEEAGEMIIVYHSNTGEIVGHCSRVFDSGKWREATIDELFPDHAKSGFAAVHFADDARYLAYRPHHWRLRRDESGVVTGIERLPMLSLTYDASDSDSDGIPDLPADSASIAHVTAKTSDDADVDITFRTTRGSLGQRTVHTTKGSAAVELRAAGETVAVTVTATAPGYRPGNLQMEFVPAQTTRAKRD